MGWMSRVIIASVVGYLYIFKERNVMTMYLLATGKMFQNKDGWYQCQGGPTKGLTSPPSSLSTATIAAVAASVLLLVVIAFITWCCKCKGRQKKSGKIMYLVPLDQGELE